MPAVQIRECPNELYRCIKASAEANHRSVTREVTILLESCFQQSDTHVRQNQRAEALAKLDALGPLPLPISAPSVSDILRNEEDRRADACLS